MRPISKPAGFTLVEMVIVMTIVGILAAGAATFIRNPIQSSIDNENHANLSDRADTALRRMARDISNALPNSVRTNTCPVNNVTANCFIEFVPVTGAGRYRAAKGTSAADDPLDFLPAADPETFEVLGPTVTVATGDKLVIYNLGIPGSDVYEGLNVRPLSATATASILKFTGGSFPQASPSSRFFVVSTTVTYACDMSDAANNNGKLLRYSGYAIQASQPVSLSAAQPASLVTTSTQVAPNLLASGLTACSIKYDNAVLQRNGLVTIYFTMQQDGAKVSLMHQVNVVNSP